VISGATRYHMLIPHKGVRCVGAIAKTVKTKLHDA